MQVRVRDLVRPTKRINFGTPFTPNRMLISSPRMLGSFSYGNRQFNIEVAAEISSQEQESNAMWKEL